MADTLDQKLPLISKLMLVVLSPSSAEGEWSNAFEMLQKTLKEVDPGGHGLVERIKTPPVSDDEMQKLFDAGREQGRIEAVAQQRSMVSVATRPFSGGNPNSPTYSRLYGFDDNARVSGRHTYNGYTWSAIANHCTDHLHRIPDKHHGFLEGMADRLVYGDISGKQAKYLGDLFRQYLSGRI
jgi:hypothetical protein